MAGPIGDYYYVYYSVSSFGTQVSAIGVARSKTMEAGTWEDLGSTGITSKAGSAYNAIDANLISTSDGYYMTFGSFWGDLYQVKMASPPVQIASGASAVQIAYQPSGAHAVEAAFIWQRAPYFYLFFSVGSCCGYDKNRPAKGAEYAIKVCRSSSVSGPYVSS